MGENSDLFQKINRRTSDACTGLSPSSLPSLERVINAGRSYGD